MEDNQENLSMEEILSSIRNILMEDNVRQNELPQYLAFDEPERELSLEEILESSEDITEVVEEPEELLEVMDFPDEEEEETDNEFVTPTPTLPHQGGGGSSQDISENILNGFAKLFEGHKVEARPVPVVAKGKTIEELIAVEISKQVSDWLNANMENVVKEIVSEEVARVMVRAGK